jgi:hypothetical protein
LHDTEILKREKVILASKVQLENVKRALVTEKDLKRQLDSKSEITKETVFVKSGKSFMTADVNDPDHFSEPVGDATKICLKDASRCFPFKIENGKRVLAMNKQEVNIEFQNLKAARANYNGAILEESLKRDGLIVNRTFVNHKMKRSEKRFDNKQESLNGYIDSNKAGMSEEFIDEMVRDSNKEMLFGSSEIDPGNADTKGALVNALNKKVFAKDSYGLLKDNESYQNMDKEYEESLYAVSTLQKKYDLDSPALTIVSPAISLLPDESLIKRVPAQEENVLAVEKPVEIVEVRPNYLKKEEEIKEENVVNNKIMPFVIPELGPEDEDVVVKKDEVPVIKKDEPIVKKEEIPVVIKKEDECTPDDENCKDESVVIKKEADECQADDDNCKDEIPVVIKEEPKVETPEELCKKEAVAKILELFKDDKQNILGKQFNLTAMKTAMYLKGKAAPGSVPVSLEAAMNRDQESLSKDEKITELKKIYADHGIDSAGAGMDEMVAKMKSKKFNYYSTANRMSNDEASKLYLLLSKSDSPVKFGMEDAAVAWAFGQMNKFEKGSSQYNKMNLSNHVNKMMNATIAGGTNMSVEKLQADSKAEEKAIDDAINESLKTISAACLSMIPENCLVIGDAKQDAFAEMVKTIISKQENKMDDKELKGFHVEAKNYLGQPGEADYIEIGAKRLKKNIPAFTPASLKKVQIAAGKTVMSRKAQPIRAEGKCFETKYEAGLVGVTEVPCK